MDFGIIGLGRMGRSIARQAMEKGHRVVAYNRTQRVTDDLARDGIDPTTSIEELVSKLRTPRIIFIYLPHGDPDDLLALVGLDAAGLVAEVRRFT